MHHFAFEILQAWNIWLPWHVELAHSRYQKVGRNDIAGVVLAILVPRNTHFDLPLRLSIVPSGFFDGGIESNMLVESVLLSRLDEVCLEEKRM
jgi:hypothetical protein